MPTDMRTQFLRGLSFSLLFSVILSSFPLAGEEKKTILFLDSYHPGYLWSEDLKSGLFDNLSFDQPDYNFFIEYLDTKKYDSETLFPLLVNSFEKKYSEQRPDILISSDNNAFSFLKLYRDRIFPGVPVVFCGVNNFEDTMLEGFSDATGIVEEASYRETLELALTLFPETERVFSVAGSSETGKSNVVGVRRAFGELGREDLEFSELHDITLEEFASEFQRIPEHSVIIYSGLHRDSIGKTFGSVRDSLEFIRQNTDQPVFSMWSQHLPFCFGGVMISGRSQGRSASEIALRILQGENVKDIPIIRESPNRPMVNYEELSRFEIDQKALPEGTVLINLPPPSLYSQYKQEFWFILIIFLTLILLVITLLFMLSYRDMALKKKSRVWNHISAIFDSMPSSLIGVDLSLRISQWNTSAEKRSGIPKEKAVGKPLEEFYSSFPCNFDQVRRAVLSQKSFMERNIRVEKEDGDIYEDITVFPLVSDEVTGAVIRIDDVSERMRLDELELQSKNLQDQLIQSQKMDSIGRLAGGVSHDLNNLLVPIIGYSEILLNDENLTRRQKDVLGEVLKAGIRSQDLIRQLLAFSRKQVLEVKQLDLNGVIRDFGKLLRRTIKENITIHYNLSDRPLHIMADRGQIEQVLMNLVVNAADALPEGGSIEIRTALLMNTPQSSEGDRSVLLAIHDNGAGMDELVTSKIFEPFFSTKGSAGTGLGLATVHGIIRQHNGDINVDSAPGKGTTFNIYLPFREKDLKKSEPISYEVHEERFIKGSETILVVEDNPQVLSLSREVLEKNGYKVITASSSSLALPVIEENDLDLLLTDIVMPEINGKELYSQACRKKPELKVLYMSGYNDKIITHIEGEEFDIPFIQKPFTEKQLLQKIRYALEQDPS